MKQKTQRMPKKTKTKAELDPAKQHKRFKEAARELGAKDGKAFERTFGKIVPPAKPKKSG